jgi:putative hemolysin
MAGNVASRSRPRQRIALTLVVAVLTYFSVVVGELVPKRLGLLAPGARRCADGATDEPALATGASPGMAACLVVQPAAAPAWCAHQTQESSVTDDEIKVLMSQGAKAGVFHASEQAIVANVLRLDEQHIGAIMTPRKDIYLLDLNASEAEIRKRLAESPYKRIVACRDGLENVIGILRTNDLLKGALSASRSRSSPLSGQRCMYPPASRPPNCLKPSAARASSAR